MARNENPGALGGATGAANCHSVKTHASILVLDGFNSNKAVTFNWCGTIYSAKGRDAWALWELIRAGEKGCTPMDAPAPRWSAYVHKLRSEYALPIETVHEVHEGPFKGVHGRYVLRAKVRFTEGKA
jgi:hypothetical protein